MEGLPESVLIRERFGELFEAAQMLLRGGVTQEERVIPTLAFANCVQVVRSLAAEKEQLVAAWEDPEAWEHEVEIFSWKHASLEPVRVVEGILVLERRPVYVDIHTPVYVGEWDAKPTAKERAKVLWDREVVIAVYPHPKPASSQHVANLYERALSAAGVSCEESREALVGSIRVEYREDHLLIIVEHGDKTIPAEHREAAFRKLVFPHSDRVGEHYQLLMGKPSGGGFSSYLHTRKRGRAPEPETLIPACVAFYLRTYIQSREQIHKLLNEHVLRDTWKALPEEDCSSSQTNQLWRDARRFGERLLAASHPLYLSEPGWILSHNRFSLKKLF
jgi:hypothetical protein